jgi:hydrogenase expression/formation protein HypC
VDEPVAIGDYVLNHVGYAIRRIPEREIGETLALYELLLREAEREDGGPSGPSEDGGPSGPWPEDAMAADVRGEIAAAAPSRGSRRGG